MTTTRSTGISLQTATGRARRRRIRRPWLAPLILISANVVFFAVFFVWPGAIGVVYSFTNYTGVGGFSFVGLQNYQQLFADPAFYHAIIRTLLFAIMVVPLTYVLSLGIAVLLTSNYTRGKAVGRIVFFVPWLISPIVTGVLWRWMFGENFGLINYLIQLLGGHGLPWQSNANLSLVIVAFAESWAGTAFNMLLFIAALKNVPRAYYEASALDGAGSWAQFRAITLPSIGPTSFIVILLSTINAIKEFATIQSLNNGGPGTENNLIVQYIYQTGFQSGRIGYASAASMILMLILMAIALIQLAVNHRGEKK